MTLYAHFAQALQLSDFLAKFGSDGDRTRWKSVHDQVALTNEQRSLLAQFRREQHVLVLAGAWCGDCVRQCPIFEHFAAAAPVLKIRYLDRDEYPDVQQELSVNGGKRVPVVVFFSEDGYEVGRYGDRTLATYRQMMLDKLGNAGPNGITTRGDSLLSAVTQDWLNEFERGAMAVAIFAEVEAEVWGLKGKI